jgi:hypothetical protein
MAYTLLIPSKLLISSSLIAKVFTARYSISSPSNLINGRCNPIGPEAEQHQEEQGCLQHPQLQRKKTVNKYFAFG